MTADTAGAADHAPGPAADDADVAGPDHTGATAQALAPPHHLAAAHHHTTAGAAALVLTGVLLLLVMRTEIVEAAAGQLQQQQLVISHLQLLGLTQVLLRWGLLLKL